MLLVCGVLVIALLTNANRKQHPVLQTTQLEDGSELNLNACFLTAEDSFECWLPGPLGMSPKTISQFSIHAVNRPKAVLVFSVRDPETLHWPAFYEFGSVRITDKFGGESVTDRRNCELLQGETFDYGRSGDDWCDSYEQQISRQDTIKAGYRFLLVPMHLPECDGPVTIRFLTDNGNEVARIDSTISLPAPDTALGSHEIQLEAEQDIWAGKISETKFTAIRGAAWNNNRPDSRVVLAPKFLVERKGVELSDEELVVVNASIKDAMGNTIPVVGEPLPTGQKIWQLTVDVARSSAASFDDSELKKLATVSIQTQPKIVQCESQSGPQHLVLIPPGKHSIELPKPEFHWRQHEAAHRCFQTGKHIAGLVEVDAYIGLHRKEGRPWITSSSASPGLGSDTAECSQYAAIPPEPGNDRSFVEFKTDAEGKHIQLNCECDLPTIILGCEPTRPEQVTNLQVRDRLGNRVPVYPLFHPVADLPIYAIRPATDQTEQLTISYCTEDLTTLKFFVPTPHSVMAQRNDSTEPATAILDIESKTWNLEPPVRYID